MDKNKLDFLNCCFTINNKKIACLKVNKYHNSSLTKLNAESIWIKTDNRDFKVKYHHIKKYSKKVTLMKMWKYDETIKHFLNSNFLSN